MKLFISQIIRRVLMPSYTSKLYHMHLFSLFHCFCTEHAYCNKGKILYTMRLAFKYPARVRTRYCHVCIVFREGAPPKEYYPSEEMTGFEKMEDYIKKQRERRILFSL